MNDNKLIELYNFIHNNLLKELYELSKNAADDKLLSSRIILILNSYGYIKLICFVLDWLKKNNQNELIKILDNYYSSNKSSPNIDFDMVDNFLKQHINISINCHFGQIISKNILIFIDEINEEYKKSIMQIYKVDEVNDLREISNMKRKFSNQSKVYNNFKKELSEFKFKRAIIAHPHLEFFEDNIGNFSVIAFEYYIIWEIFFKTIHYILEHIEITFNLTCEST